MRLVFDIETNPIDFDLGDPTLTATDVWCIVAQDVDAGVVLECTARNMDYAIRTLEKADELIGHNIIEFDIPVLQRLFNFNPGGKITDTLVVSRLLYPDRPGGHSLDAWGTRLGYSKAESPGFEQYTRELVDYCRTDVALNLRVFERLEVEQRDHDWSQSIESEHKVADIIARQARSGVYFDKPLAENTIAKIDTQLSGVDDKILKELPQSTKVGTVISEPFKINGDLKKRTITLAESNGINGRFISGPFSTFEYSYPKLGSKDQQKKILLEHGWKPAVKTVKGNPQLDDQSVSEVQPLGPLFLKRNALSHKRSQIVGLVNRVRDVDGRLPAGANPCATPTGRMRHRVLVNIPKVKVLYGREMRSLCTVGPGNLMGGYDARAAQLRSLAHYIGNEDYAQRVRSTDPANDAHVLAARAAGSTDRDLGKTINYALIFGARDKQLGAIVGGTKADGARIRKRLYAEIPGFQAFVARVEAASRKGWLQGLDGRKLFPRPGKSVVNLVIQAAEAICMKQIAIYLDELMSNCKSFKVIDMHDEAQWELFPDEVDQFKASVERAFELTNEKFKLRCPYEPDIKIGNNWSETH